MACGDVRKITPRHEKATKKTEFFTTIIRKTRFDEGGLGGRTRRGITLCPLNALARNIKVVLEKKMMREKLLNYHPLRNDATTTIAASDLLKFIYAMGHTPIILDM